MERLQFVTAFLCGIYLSPAAYKSHNPALIAPFSVTDPPPRCPPHPPPPADQTSFPQNSQLYDSNFLTCPNPSKSVDSSRQEDAPVTAPPPKHQPTQHASGRSSKKRKAGKSDDDDGIVRAFLYFSLPPDIEPFPAQTEGFASMLREGKAGEPCQTLEIRWAQAQRRSPSG